MFEVHKTERFVRLLAGLRDLRGRAKVLARIESLIGGKPGDVKAVGACVSELRIIYGPAYRVNYLQPQGRIAYGGSSSLLSGAQQGWL